MGSRSQLQAKGKNMKVPGLTEWILIRERVCTFIYIFVLNNCVCSFIDWLVNLDRKGKKMFSVPSDTQF